MINTTSNNSQKLVEIRLKRIRERNKNAVLFMKKPLAIFLIIVSVVFISIYTTSLIINFFKVFLLLFIPMFFGLVISFYCIPKINDFLKPLVDTVLYIPASILAVCYILNTVTNINDELKKAEIQHWYVYLALCIIAGSTIIKCSIAYSESFSKYIILCENSHSNNLTPTILLRLKYRTRHLYKRFPSIFRRFFKIC